MLKKFIHVFVLSCKQATLLIEKQLHTSLSLHQRVQLSIHLGLCKHCCKYRDKALFLDHLIRERNRKEHSPYRFNPDEIDEFIKQLKTTLL